MTDLRNDAAPGSATEGIRTTNNNASECVTIHCSDDLAFARRLAALGIPIFVAPPTSGGGEFRRPDGWQRLTADGNDERLSGWKPGWAVCAVTGEMLTVLDVDPRNGGDVDYVRGFLDAHGVRAFAEIATPSGGAHFYCAGDPRLHKAAVPELPGVDVQSRGCNVFLPGTVRSHGEYMVVRDADLDALTEGDADGVDVLLDLVGRASAPIDTTGVTDVEIAVLLTAGSPDADVSERLEQAVADLASARAQGRSRHKTALSAVGGLLRFGEYADGVAGAVAKLESVFVPLVADRATPADARAEFQSLVRFMATVIAADPTRCVVDLDNFDDVAAFVAGTTLTRDRLVEVLSAPLPVDPEVTFWSARESLRRIKHMADARTESPWALFGAVLCRALADVGVTVRIPPIVGSPASLNFAVALVGPSGSGKSTALAIAAELWPSSDPDLVAPAGSGEGFAARFVKPRSQRKGMSDEDFAALDPMVWLRRRSVFAIDEIGEWAALAHRPGFTGIAKFRTMWTGGELGNQNATHERNRRTGSHTYRATLIAGVQPAAAGVLLDDHGAGTPQRFIWMPTTDFDVVAVDDPEPFNTWLPPTLTRDSGDAYMFPIPDSVRAVVRSNHIANKRGGDGGYDGHAMLCRLKVAVGLAVLDGRDAMTVDDWMLSGVVMAVSDRTRASCVRHAEASRRATARAAGRLRAEADDAAAETGDALTAERYRQSVLLWLADGPRRRRDVEKKKSGSYRVVLRGVLDDLVTRGVLRESDGWIEVSS